jgi:tRNA 2-thiouridine synthesizing protein A
MSQTDIHVDEVLDASGLLCPMPVIRTSKAMKLLGPGQVLRLVATDRGSVADIPAWADSTGNELLEWHEEGDTFVFLLRKGEKE